MRWAWAMMIAVATTSADMPRVAKVSVDAVDVLDEPDDAAFSTGRIDRGRRVVVRGEGPDGWAAIVPPEGAFSLVEEGDLEDLGDGRARVIVRYATVRPGRDGARVPGPPRLTLAKGTLVRLVDRRPLVVRRRDGQQSWIAIVPPKAEVRFVRVESLADWPEGNVEAEPPPRRDSLASSRIDAERPRDAPPASPRTPGLGPIDPDFASTGDEADLSELPPEFATQVRAIASRHRAILRAPIDRWDLAGIESAYQRLLQQGPDLGEKRVLEKRLARVARQRKASTAARALNDLVRTGRERDGRSSTAADLGENAETGTGAAYDASGLLQTSAQTSEGRKVFALFGDDGHVACYLAFPPGLAVAPFLSHRVGVRGDGRFDEGLRARLIRVKDLELLNGKP